MRSKRSVTLHSVNDTQTSLSAVDSEATNTYSELTVNTSTSVSPAAHPSLAELLDFVASRKKSLLLDSPMSNKKVLEVLKSVVNISDILVSNASLTDILSNSSSYNLTDDFTFSNNREGRELAISDQKLSSIQMSTSEKSDLDTHVIEILKLNTTTGDPSLTNLSLTGGPSLTNLSLLSNLANDVLGETSDLDLCSKIPDLQKVCSTIKLLENLCQDEHAADDNILCSVPRTKKSLCLKLSKLETVCSGASSISTLSFWCYVLMVISLIAILQ